MAKRKKKPAAQAVTPVRRTAFQLKVAGEVAAARAKDAQNKAYEAAKLAQNARGAYARANKNPTAQSLYEAAKLAQNARGAAARAAEAVVKAKNSKVKLNPNIVRAVQSVAATTGLQVDQQTDDALGVAYGQATGDLDVNAQPTPQAKAKKKRGIKIKLKIPKAASKLLKKAVSFVPGGTTLSNIVGVALDNKGRLPSWLKNRKKKEPDQPPEIGVEGSFPPSANDPNGDGVNNDGTLTQAATVAVNTGTAKPPEPLVKEAIDAGKLPPEAAVLPPEIVNRPQPRPVLIQPPTDEGGGDVIQPPMTFPAPSPGATGPAPGGSRAMPAQPPQEIPEPPAARPAPITGPIYDAGGELAQPRGGADLMAAGASLPGDTIFGLPKPVVYVGGAVLVGLVLVMASGGRSQPQYIERGRR